MRCVREIQFKAGEIIFDRNGFFCLPGLSRLLFGPFGRRRPIRAFQIRSDELSENFEMEFNFDVLGANFMRGRRSASGCSQNFWQFVSELRGNDRIQLSSKNFKSAIAAGHWIRSNYFTLNDCLSDRNPGSRSMRHAPANSERQLNFLPNPYEGLENSISRGTGFALRECGESSS